MVLTFAPASAKALATSNPMPPEPPVMITVRPSRRNCLKTESWTEGFGARMDTCSPFEPILSDWLGYS